MAVIAVNIIVAVLVTFAPPAGGDEPDGRWVNLGPWAPVVRCEMGPTGDAQVTSWAGARGAFQFMQYTWDNMNGAHSWPEGRRYRPRLIGRDPAHTTLAQQLRVAETLRVRVVGGGMDHWDCHRFGLARYGSTPGDTLVWVENEFRMPKHPRRCATNLIDEWGIRPVVARSVCGVT